MANERPVTIELGRKRVFASALEWPGWCRSGRSEEEALEALATYGVRYARVAELAGLDFDPDRGGLVVVEALAGSATTDFGAPGAHGPSDERALGPVEAARVAAIVTASWRLFDEIVEGAPDTLRKGPRGGGRDTAAVVEHVEQAERAYAAKLGVRTRAAEGAPPRREALDAALRSGVDGAWHLRYAARRIAWHVLDHAWEVEDRSR